jgi:hypothetical protein
MTKRNINIIDKIGKLIPGYEGYAIRDQKRNEDKKVRLSISSYLDQCEIKIIDYQKKLIQNNQIHDSQEWEIARKKLNTFSSKVKNTSYGETSFFNENQIKEDELDVIYTLDLELMERTSLILKTIESEINITLSPALVNNQIEELNKLLLKRINFLNRF